MAGNVLAVLCKMPSDCPRKYSHIAYSFARSFNYTPVMIGSNETKAGVQNQRIFQKLKGDNRPIPANDTIKVISYKLTLRVEF